MKTARALALALVGTGALVAIAARYHLDRTLCAAWPPYATGAAYGALYLAALVALVLAWRARPAGWVAGPAHAAALLAVPFLSSDPLMYAAVGRALAGGAAATTSVRVALGADHPFLAPLPLAWRDGTSAYGPLWNLVAAAIGRLAGDDLALALRLHQGLAMAAILLAAGIVAPLRPRAFAVVALCPLAIVEGTIGAHNDALLMPLAAGAIRAWLGGRRALAMACLAAGLLWKASAALLLLPALAAIALAALPSDRARKRALAGLVALALVGLAALPLLAGGPLDAVARLVGRPDVPFDHCTRSIECLPRVLFRFVLHAPTAAWATGLCFRGLGILWLGWTALTAARAADDPDPAAPIAALARGLFVYFLLLHGWAQSWYLLPLLPALPLLVEGIEGVARAIRLYLVTAVAYYAVVLPMSCLSDPVLVAVSDLAEAAITILPPAYLLLRRRGRP